MELSQQKNMIQAEETSPQAGITQGMLSRVGQSINHINKRQFDCHHFNLNGFYNIADLPFSVVDGYISYPYAFEIAEVLIFSGPVIGTSGVTELDIKWKPQSSGSFASIFSTTPKINSTAQPMTQASIGYQPSGFTSPILSKTTFAAYDYLRIDLLQTMAGDPEGVYVKVFTRPI